MATAIQAVKREYEDTIVDTHREMAVSRASHWGFAGIEDLPGAAVPKMFSMGYSAVEEHLETGIVRLRLGGNLCGFCLAFDERGVENRFAELVAEWRRGTGGLSSPRAIASHPAYQQIVQMGEMALPMIFQELLENGGWWYPALRALTGQNPVPEEAKGRPPLNREAWLDWGRRNGYLQP